MLVLATVAVHQPAAHASSCFTYTGDTPLPSSVRSGCDLAFLSEDGDYAIEELIMESSIDGVSTSVPFEGERRTRIVATDYGWCNPATCTYEESRTEEEFGLYVLSPLVTLPDEATITISRSQPDGAPVALVSFEINDRGGECYSDDYPAHGSCIEPPCDMQPYTGCAEGDGTSGCSASSSLAGWPPGAMLALLLLAGTWRRHRRLPLRA